MDRDHAATYDEFWGEISTTHAAFVGRLLELVRPRGLLLDAACGTGKYWPMLLEAGMSVVGIDQSAGMLRQATLKHPAVAVAKVGLQDMAYDACFDGVLCIDALENIAPEDWPIVADRLAAAARPAAPLYATVELPPAADVETAYLAARAAGQPVVEGEDFDGIGHHFYPSRANIDEWLSGAGLELIEEAEGDEYLHLLLRRGPSAGVEVGR
jgi:SAM-dependent methyltransferase